MTDTEHPNIAILKRFDPRDPAAAADLLADDFVWHYFNPKLPDIQGDYAGVDGLKAFFKAMGAKSHGSFKVAPQSATAHGDELVVVHVRNTMMLDGEVEGVREGEPFAIDAVVVWRIVDGRIAEGWDIPAVHTLAD